MAAHPGAGRGARAPGREAGGVAERWVAAATLHCPAAGPALLESPEKDARPKNHRLLATRGAP
ncbi:hypothetical protein [Streptomyces xantholiticus]|uniref:hypothetical protein n=1 Tax=Streptomyces xantholiticus TaxID=68285 RepID=UPI001677EF50|nr:hypothetical protein [Streptomyces xantholiticus]